MNEDKKLIGYGSIYGEDKGTGFAGNVWNPSGLCPTINTCGGGNREPLIVEEVWCCASRGRDPENPSDRRPGINLEQRLEINKDGVCNCITSVSKDAYVLTKEREEMGFADNATKNVVVDEEAVSHYRVRKLTPREAFRLMSFTDGQFDKAEEVSSNTALYKACGNSIAINCLVAILGQMIDGREDYYRRPVDKINGEDYENT